MKNLLLNTLLLVSLRLFSQITITTNDMPVLNDTIRLSIDNGVIGIDPSLTGANYTWNFSTLNADLQRVDFFQSVSATPFAYQLYFNNQIMYPNHKASYGVEFPQSMGGFQQFQIEDIYNYFKNSSQQYSQVGFGANINGIPSSVRFIPVDKQYTFPLAFGNIDSSYSEWGVSIPNVGYIGQRFNRKDTVDGWGELTTPFGTFTTLRVKSVVNRTDTVYLSNFGFGTLVPRPTETEYKWLSANGKLPILTLTKTLNAINAVYRDNYRPVTQLGLASHDDALNFRIFPNPCSEFVLIEWEEPTHAKQADIKLLDCLGQLVHQVSYPIYSGAQRLLLPMDNVQPGIYVIQVERGNSTHSRKLVLVR